MTGIVIELQREALDKSVRVSDLLRKALLVARKLKVRDIETWILHELNGYPGKTAVPEYRMGEGEVKYWNPFGGGWAPVIFPPNAGQVVKKLTTVKCGQQISEIEALIERAADGQLATQFPHDVQSNIMQGAALPSPPMLIIQESRLHGMVDAVRTAILNWALQLEEKGVLGENLSFSDADRKAASNITFNIASMSHSQIQAETSRSQQVMVDRSVIEPARVLEFVAKARKTMRTLALPEPARAELEGELATMEAQAKSPKPKQGILREAGASVRAILEGATGNAAGEGLMAALKALFGG